MLIQFQAKVDFFAQIGPNPYCHFVTLSSLPGSKTTMVVSKLCNGALKAME